MGTGGPALRTERGAGVAATGCLLLLRFLLSAKLLPRWCWCWLCSRFDCKSLRRGRLGDGGGKERGRGGNVAGGGGSRGARSAAGGGVLFRWGGFLGLGASGG